MMFDSDNVVGLINITSELYMFSLIYLYVIHFNDKYSTIGM